MLCYILGALWFPEKGGGLQAVGRNPQVVQRCNKDVAGLIYALSLPFKIVLPPKGRFGGRALQEKRGESSI